MIWIIVASFTLIALVALSIAAVMIAETVRVIREEGFERWTVIPVGLCVLMMVVFAMSASGAVYLRGEIL